MLPQRLEHLCPDGRRLLLVLERTKLCLKEKEGGVQRDVDVLGLALLQEARAQVEAKLAE